MFIWIGLSFLGIFVGILSGLLGIGGGVIITPALILIFSYIKFQPAIAATVAIPLAIGTSLAISSITLSSSLSHHYKKNNIDFDIFFKLFPGIIIGALLGPYIVHILPSEALKKIIGILFLILAINISFNFSKPMKFKLPGLILMALSGFVLGILATFVGISGAVFVIPYLMLFNVPYKKAIGIAAVCGVSLASMGMVSNIFISYNLDTLPLGATGYVYWPAVLAIAITSMPSSYYAARVSDKVPVLILKRLLGFVFVIISSKMLFY